MKTNFEQSAHFALRHYFLFNQLNWQNWYLELLRHKDIDHKSLANRRFAEKSTKALNLISTILVCLAIFAKFVQVVD